MSRTETYAVREAGTQTVTAKITMIIRLLICSGLDQGFLERGFICIYIYICMYIYMYVFWFISFFLNVP